MQSKIYTSLLFLLISTLLAFGQQRIKGTIKDNSTGLPIAGASLKIKGSQTQSTTNALGVFELTHTTNQFTLQISFLGYHTIERQISIPLSKNLIIELEKKETLLDEISIQTGYSEQKKELATGSFVQINEELLNRRVSTNILNRLEDVAPGLIFNRNKNAPENSISIRGESTLFSNAQPLIVIDNFPYEGDINAINPADVENITILKDAAAASIWGARAGNGVIVITTKKGRFNEKMKVNVNSNLTTGPRPDLFYQPKMSVADYIAMEETLFAKDFYKSAEAGNGVISPVVELLIAKRDNKIAAEDFNNRMEELKAHDLRNDLLQYWYQPSLNQQHALNLSGGSSSQSYFVSAGFDRNENTLKGNGLSRFTLNMNHNYAFGKKVSLSTGLYYTAARLDQGNNGYSSLYPYAELADAQGNALPVYQFISKAYGERAALDGVNNWVYEPLKELQLTKNRTNTTNYRLNFGLKYSPITDLSIDLKYQLGKAADANKVLYDPQSYFVRDLVNSYSQVSNSAVSNRPIPLGGIVDLSDQNQLSHNFRVQLNYSKTLKDIHALSFFSGAEIQSIHNAQLSQRLYGYDAEHLTSRPVDYVNSYRQYQPGGTGSFKTIPNISTERKTYDHFLSYYLNGQYSLMDRYFLTGSARLDQSNIFGVKTNQKGVPLYSLGAGWLASKEDFYPAWAPDKMKIRASFGYTGNVDNSLSAYTTASYDGGTGNANNQATGLPYSTIQNPPNPELRWERVRVINLGLDFGTRNRAIDGSIEYYTKYGMDLIGSTPFPSSTGIRTFKGNTANTFGKGIDLQVNTRQFDKGFKWYTSFFWSYTETKVTHYAIKSPAGSYLQFADGAGVAFPLEGRTPYALYSYAWAGLDPVNGDPQGYLNGELSKDYAKIIAGATPDNIVFNGSAKPLFYGALRNTISWREFSLSANISYRLAYYFRKQSVNFNSVLNGRGGHGDYSLRWQQPGDEATTNVPSLPTSANANRDNFYTYADILVQKGDHIRLQDINLSYVLNLNPARSGISKLTLFSYLNNLGIIWKAAEGNIDPDYNAFSGTPPPRTVAFGIKALF